MHCWRWPANDNGTAFPLRKEQVFHGRNLEGTIGFPMESIHPLNLSHQLTWRRWALLTGNYNGTVFPLKQFLKVGFATKKGSRRKTSKEVRWLLNCNSITTRKFTNVKDKIIQRNFMPQSLLSFSISVSTVSTVPTVSTVSRVSKFFYHVL